MTLLGAVGFIIFTVALLHCQHPCFAGPVDEQPKLESESPLSSFDNALTDDFVSSVAPDLRRAKRFANSNTCDWWGSPNRLYNPSTRQSEDVTNWSGTAKCNRACQIDGCYRGECKWTRSYGNTCQCYHRNHVCCGACYARIW